MCAFISVGPGLGKQGGIEFRQDSCPKPI